MSAPVDVLAVMDRTHRELDRGPLTKMNLAIEVAEARAAVAELIERERVLVEALREVYAINDESDGVFRKRGGTRRGLSMVTARAALARCGGVP